MTLPSGLPMGVRVDHAMGVGVFGRGHRAFVDPVGFGARIGAGTALDLVRAARQHVQLHLASLAAHGHRRVSVKVAAGAGVELSVIAREAGLPIGDIQQIMRDEAAHRVRVASCWLWGILKCGRCGTWFEPLVERPGDAPAERAYQCACRHGWRVRAEAVEPPVAAALAGHRAARDVPAQVREGSDEARRSIAAALLDRVELRLGQLSYVWQSSERHAGSR